MPLVLVNEKCVFNRVAIHGFEIIPNFIHFIVLNKIRLFGAVYIIGFPFLLYIMRIYYKRTSASRESCKESI